MTAPAQGRTDHKRPLLSPQAVGWLWMGGLAGFLVLAWQGAVALSTPTVGITDLSVTLDALKAGQPLGGLPGPAPSTETVLIWFGVFTIAGMVGLIALIFWTARWRSRRRSRRSGKGMATKRESAQIMGESKIRQDAAQTRPGMPAKTRQSCPLDQLAFHLGSYEGRKVFVGFNDMISVLGLTGSGKSTQVMIPAAVTAPGAAIVTSNEVEILDALHLDRSTVGRVWVWDLLDRAGWPEQMVWDPVAGCEDGPIAVARAAAFVHGLGADDGSTTNSAFFRTNAVIAMKALLHAAALDGRSIRDVLRWTAALGTGAVEPRQIIREAADPTNPKFNPLAEGLWEHELTAVSTGAEETVATTRNTLAQTVEPLTMQKILQWVTPAEHGPAGGRERTVFDPTAFVHSTDTLVLISDDSSATNVSPLATMLFQEIADTIKKEVPFTPHGRLDPPLRIVGDEIANVAPIPKLPQMVTELRKLGVQGIFAFQDEVQAAMRWGENQARILLNNMAVELVLPGVKNVDTLNRYSALADTIEVTEMSVSTDRDGWATSTSSSVHDKPILRPGEIRRLKDGTALAVWRNASVMVLNLTPYWKRSTCTNVSDSISQTRALRRAHRDADRPVEPTQKHDVGQGAA